MLNKDAYIALISDSSKLKTSALFFDQLFLPFIQVNDPEKMADIPTHIMYKYDYKGDQYITSQIQQDENGECYIDLADIFGKFFLYENPYEIAQFYANFFGKKKLSDNLLIGLAELYNANMDIHLVPILSAQQSSSIIPEEKDSTESVFQYKKMKAFNFCLDGIPCIIEQSLEWKQVLEVRQDKKSREKLYRFRNWASLNLTGKDRYEIMDILNQSLDDYQFALKKHGILTAAGSFSTIMSTSSSLLNLLNQIGAEQLISGATITAILTTLSVNQFIQYQEVRRAPIAYYYDIVKKAKAPLKPELHK